MAAQKIGGATQQTEATPLLIDESRFDGQYNSDDGRSETLTDSRRSDEEEAEEDDDKANQHVARGRGLLIMLSLCGLMFLQGMLIPCIFAMS
jgi:hypothetical protein